MKKEIDYNLIKSLLENSNVEFAGVFGSVARGEANDNSDIDILVRFRAPISLLGLIRLERLLSQQMGRDIDLVTEDSLSPFIKEEVLQDLKPIYEKR